MRQFGLKAFSLALLAALGLLAISSATAQAGNAISVEGSVLAANDDRSILGEGGGAQLLVDDLVKVDCATSTIEGSVENISGTGHVKFNVLFSGCLVLGGEKSCKVYEELPLVNENRILATGLGTVITHKGEYYLLVEGLGAEKQFADFLILDPKSDDGCQPLFEGHYSVTGSTVLWLPDAPKLASTHTALALGPITMATLFPDHKLKLNNKAAHIAVGSASVHMFEKLSWKIQ